MVLRTLFLFHVQFLNMLGEIANKKEKRKKFEIEINKTGKNETVRYFRLGVGDEMRCNFKGIKNFPYPNLNASDSPVKTKKEIIKELLKIKNVNGFDSRRFKGVVRFDFNKKVIYFIYFINI